MKNKREIREMRKVYKISVTTPSIINIHIIGIPEEEESISKKENPFEKIMGENIPNPVKQRVTHFRRHRDQTQRDP